MEEDEAVVSGSKLTDYVGSMRATVQVLSWCWKEFVNARARGFIVHLIFWSFLGHIVSLSYPFLMGVGIDGLIRHHAATALAASAFTALAYGAGSMFEWRAGRLIELTLGENLMTLERRVNELFFSKELGLHLEEGGKLTQENMEKGVNRFNSVQHSLLFMGVDSSLSLLLSWSMLTVLSPMASLIVSVAVAGNLLVSLHLNRFITIAMDPVERRFRALARRRGERWLGVERVVTSGRALAEVREMDQEFDSMLREDRKIWLTYIRGTIPRTILSGLSVTGAGLYAGYQVWAGHMTMASLIPILTWAGIASQQMRFLARCEREINWCSPSLKSLQAALTLPTRVSEPAHAVELADAPVIVEFDNVCHSYDHARRHALGHQVDVLAGLSFKIEPGEKVALVGPSGAGKSTVTRLIQRYMDPVSGSIRVNGQDLRALSLCSWRELVGYIPQQPKIFDGTVRDNLLYGFTPEARARITDEEIWRVMRLLRVDFGSRLTHGLETLVGRQGMKLSGGEAQRVMIAACALKRPRFMIIDEATSSLDAENQAAVQEGLEELLATVNASALIIAHRLSTVMRCDKFVVLRQVDDLKQGESQVECIADSVGELFARSPTFRRLAALEGVYVETLHATSLHPTL